MVESGHGTVGDYISGIWLQVGRLGGVEAGKQRMVREGEAAIEGPGKSEGREKGRFSVEVDTVVPSAVGARSRARAQGI